MPRLRIVSYNVHQCRGVDRRVRPDRIVRVLHEVGADLVGLQEVLSIAGGAPELDQARYFARALGSDHFCVGENLRRGGGAYGNVVVSRWPITFVRNHDISVAGREPRGVLRADVNVPEAGLVHVFNLHLGLSAAERARQAERLLGPDVLRAPGLRGPRIVVGDFNEWRRGTATRSLSAEFHSVDLRRFMRRFRTYPGILPLLHLDNIYYDPELRLEAFKVHRSRTALIASDHLPLVAEFTLE